MADGGTGRKQQTAAPKRERRSFAVFGKRPGEIGGTVGGNGRRAGGLQRTTGGNGARGWGGIRARICGQFNGWLSTMPVTAGLCVVYCVRTASVWCRAEGAKRLLLEAGRSDERQRVGRGSAAIRGGQAIASGGSAGARKDSVGNSAKAIREPGAFRLFGSAVRRSGGQAVFDGAVFTAKGEG